MNRLPLDENLPNKLRTLSQQTELCDESGRIVGQFFPEDVYRRLLFSWSNAQISEDELLDRLNQPGGESLAQVWSRLGVK